MTGGSVKAEGLGDGPAGAMMAVVIRLYSLTGARPVGSLPIQGDRPADRKDLMLTLPIVHRFFSNASRLRAEYDLAGHDGPALIGDGEEPDARL